MPNHCLITLKEALLVDKTWQQLKNLWTKSRPNVTLKGSTETQKLILKSFTHSWFYFTKKNDVTTLKIIKLIRNDIDYLNNSLEILS